MRDRYLGSGPEFESEPGSNELVLRNNLGITTPEELEDAEATLLDDLYSVIFQDHFPNRRIYVEDILGWHGAWLDTLYDWAGRLRTANVSKGGFAFAISAQVPALLSDFQAGFLDRHTPCHGISRDQLVQALAEVHVEFILIHPFREGNGRIARLLADIMVTQAGWAPLDYAAWNEDRTLYYTAIQHGLAGDYELIAQLFDTALGKLP